MNKEQIDEYIKGLHNRELFKMGLIKQTTSPPYYYHWYCTICGAHLCATSREMDMKKLYNTHFETQHPFELWVLENE